MRKYSFHKLKEFINNKVFQRIDRKILVYLIFVGIATIFWFLNELSNTYNTTISYPIRFTRLPKNKSLVNDLPKNLQLSINADGYTILRYKLSPAAFPVIINFEKHSNNVSDYDVTKFKLQTRYLRETINKQMANEIEIVDIFPDTILFQFANIINKRIVVKPHVKLEFSEECMLNGDITFKPDSITVRGPNTILDTLKAVYTKYHIFTKLNKPTTQNISLKEIDKLEYNNKKVQIHLPASKFTQSNFDIEINAINVPDSLVLKTFPRSVTVSCMVSLNDYDKIKTEDFIIEVDYLDIEKLLGGKLSLDLRLAPTQVRSISYHPESVEFIIDKKP